MCDRTQRRVPSSGSQNALILATLTGGGWLANESVRSRAVDVAGAFPSGEIQERWLSKVAITDGCWLWTRGKSWFGHGVFHLNGGYVYAHRIAYEWFVGPIPEGLEIDHVCCVPACVNPMHLEAVTHAENVRRGRVGENMSSRTHCNQGHEFTPENTRTRSDCNGRVCLTCAREANRRYKERNRELLRERDRVAKRRQSDREGKSIRWAGRVHPRYQSASCEASVSVSAGVSLGVPACVPPSDGGWDDGDAGASSYVQLRLVA